MCIAIMKSANKKISKSTLRRCYDANPDGAGFMYAEDKQLVVKKGQEHETGRLIQRCMRDVQQHFEFRCELDSDYKYGRTWADTH